MQIVVRLLPSDQWSEFTFSPEATFIQLKVEVLRHWHILPERLPLTSNSSSQTQASDNLPHSGTRAEWTAKETRIHRQPSHSSTLSKEQGLDASKGERRRVSLLSSSGSGMLGESTQYQPQSESLRECARILAKHAFRSVCNGCFLPDDEVLAKHCVEYDLLIIQPRSFNITIDPGNFTQPMLRLPCSVSFPKAGETSLDGFREQPSGQRRKQRTLTQSRPSTASKIPSSTLRTLSSYPEPSETRMDRSFKHVRLQVSGDKLWLHRIGKDGSTEYGEDCLKSYTLPAIISTITNSTTDTHTLKLGFLNGDLLLVRALSERDWSDLLRCLGPTGIASDNKASKTALEWRKKVYDRAVRSTLGLLPAPSEDQPRPSPSPSNMIFPKTYNLSGTAHPEAVKSVASEPGGVPEEEPAVLQHFAASEQEKPLSIRSEVRPPVRFLDDADNAQYLDKRKRHSGDSSLEGQSLSAGWASTSSSPLLENSQQRLGRSRGMRLLARDDRRAGLKSEEDHSPRRFFTEVEENLPTVRQAL